MRSPRCPSRRSSPRARLPWRASARWSTAAPSTGSRSRSSPSTSWPTASRPACRCSSVSRPTSSARSAEPAHGSRRWTRPHSRRCSAGSSAVPTATGWPSRWPATGSGTPTRAPPSCSRWCSTTSRSCARRMSPKAKLRAATAPVYSYLFSWGRPGIGAPHGSELTFLFDHLSPALPPYGTTMRDHVLGAWVAFARPATRTTRRSRAGRPTSSATGP